MRIGSIVRLQPTTEQRVWVVGGVVATEAACTWVRVRGRGRGRGRVRVRVRGRVRVLPRL
jgi:hypothetical protein